VVRVVVECGDLAGEDRAVHQLSGGYNPQRE
jgi:hypothetical protein